MKRSWIALAALVIAFVVAALAGCYPHTCAPSDTSCWPCPTPGTTNPACVSPLTDSKKDGGVK